MSRRSAIWDFYDFNKEKNTAICKQCLRSFGSPRYGTSNLKRHLFLKHKEQWELVCSRTCRTISGDDLIKKILGNDDDDESSSEATSIPRAQKQPSVHQSDNDYDSDVKLAEEWVEDADIDSITSDESTEKISRERSKPKQTVNANKITKSSNQEKKSVMNRKRSKLWYFYDIIKGNDSVSCKLCQKTLSIRFGCNLRRHLILLHKEQWELACSRTLIDDLITKTDSKTDCKTDSKTEQTDSKTIRNNDDETSSEAQKQQSVHQSDNDYDSDVKFTEEWVEEADINSVTSDDSTEEISRERPKPKQSVKHSNNVNKISKSSNKDKQLASRKKRSKLWYFYDIIKENEIVSCKLCLQRLSYRHNTSNLIRHLISKHEVQWQLACRRTISDDLITKTLRDNDDETSSDSTSIPQVQNQQSALQSDTEDEGVYKPKEEADSVSSYRKKKSRKRTKPQQTGNTKMSKSSNQEKQSKDVYDTFGVYVGGKIRDLSNPQTKVNVQQLITTILWQAEYGMYNNFEAVNKIITTPLGVTPVFEMPQAEFVISYEDQPKVTEVQSVTRTA